MTERTLTGLVNKAQKELDDQITVAVKEYERRRRWDAIAGLVVAALIGGMVGGFFGYTLADNGVFMEWQNDFRQRDVKFDMEIGRVKKVEDSLSQARGWIGDLFKYDQTIMKRIKELHHEEDDSGRG